MEPSEYQQAGDGSLRSRTCLCNRISGDGHVPYGRKYLPSFYKGEQMRAWKSAVVVGVAALMVAGCATSKATINTSTDPSFQRGDIQSIAVLPIRNTRAAPSEARQITRKVSQAIHKDAPSMNIVGPNEAVNLLNEHELADDWAEFLENYVKSGVPDAQTLSKIGEALGVDAICQGEVWNVQQEDGEWGGNKGETRVTVRFTILDARDGSLLWEASSDGVRGTSTTLGDAPPVIEAINLAVDKIVQNMPAFGS